jgi:hypothetical protein
MELVVLKIIDILRTDSTLQTLLSGTVSDKKVYPGINPSFENFPCITYEVIGSFDNEAPRSTQEGLIQLHLYTKASKDNLEDISTRIKTLLQYYKIDTPRIYELNKQSEIDMNETDRLLWGKVLRYTIWSQA